tara:strand:+ start:534 stop:836 length:303 start_codon:yes stop_codon:yes gene_type:complete
MEKGLFNIADENIHTLIDKDISRGSVSFIRICNAHASIDAVVRLFLDDDTNQTSIVENLTIPAGVTLEVDKISFDNSVLALKIQMDAVGSTTVDTNVILK